MESCKEVQMHVSETLYGLHPGKSLVPHQPSLRTSYSEKRRGMIPLPSSISS